MKMIFTIFLSTFLSFSLSAQTSLSGKVTDAKSNEVLIGANVTISKNGVFVAGTSTNFEGNFIIRIDPGAYEVKVSFVGYEDNQIESVVLKPGQNTTLNVPMNAGTTLETIVVREYSVPLIEVDNTTSGCTVRSGISTFGSGARKTTIVDTRPNTLTSPSELTIRGSRAGAEDYYIDGIRVNSEIVNSTEYFLSGTEAAFEKNHIKQKSQLDVIVEKKTSRYNAFKAYKKTIENDEPEIEAGILTAGEWNALEDWNFWEDLLSTKNDTYQKRWQIFPSQRISVVVENLADLPIPDCIVKLLDRDGKVVWQSKTDNKGKAELWANLFGEKQADFIVTTEYEGIISKMKKPLLSNPKINKIKLPVSCKSVKNLDIAFVVDATGSMADEINYLKSELRDVINQVQEDNKVLNIRTASVFYRDHGDEYVTRSSPFSQNINKTIQFISGQRAAGGGDFPEAVNAALEEALKMEWSENTVGKILFLVLDAPPHNHPEALKELQKHIRKAAALGIRIIPITASGINKSTEFLMKSMAMTTNGTYVFITDHSGIGNPHLEATVPNYSVEMLNELMVRLITDFSAYEDCSSPKQIRKMEVAEGVDLSSSESMYLNQLIYFYPNPADSKVTIELKEEFTQIDLINVMGKTVKNIAYPKAGVSRINVSDLPGGTYFLQFKKGVVVITKRLIIAKP